VYRFLVSPRWILSHLFAVAVVAACVTAGLWQLDRLGERRDRNALLAEWAELAVVPVAELLGPGSTAAEADAVTYRRVVVEGTYRVDDDVLVANRTSGGSPGYWVLTPVDLGEGVGVLVNRGWIPLRLGDDPVDRAALAAPAAGRVRVVGLVSPTQERGSPGPVDPVTGRIERLARVDVAAVDAQVAGLELVPAWVLLEAQEPPAGAWPAPADPPEPGEGPHLSYALQWAFFAALAGGGYLLILRRVARDRAAGRGPGHRRRSSPIPVDD
jgi:cytochrome oxidase assembly protein ShyY1